MSLDAFVQRLDGTVDNCLVVEQAESVRDADAKDIAIDPASLSTLVDHITSEEKNASSRRWLGVLFLEIIQRRQDLVDSFTKTCKHIPRQLGHAVLSTSDESVKLVIGRIIYVCIRMKMLKEHFWPRQEHQTVRDGFPVSQDSQWLVEYDQFNADRAQDEGLNESVYMMLKASADGLSMKDESSPEMLIVGTTHLTLVTPPAQSIHFVDIPFQSIASTKWSKHETPGKPSNVKENVMVGEIHLSMSEPHEFLVDAKVQTADNLRLTFWDFDEAKMALQSMRDRRDLLIKPVVRQSTGDMVSAGDSHATNGVETADNIANAASPSSIRFARTSTSLTQNVDSRETQDGQHTPSEVLPYQQITESLEPTVSAKGKLKPHPKHPAATKRKLHDDAEQQFEDGGKTGPNSRQAKRQRVPKTNKSPMTGSARHEAVVDHTTTQSKSQLPDDPYSLEDERTFSAGRNPGPSRNSVKTRAAVKADHKSNLSMISSTATLSHRHPKTKKLQGQPGLSNIQALSKDSDTTASLPFDASIRKPAIVAWSPNGPANQGKSRLVADRNGGPEDYARRIVHELDDMASGQIANTPCTLTNEGFKKPAIPKRLRHGLSNTTALHAQKESSTYDGVNQQNGIEHFEKRTHRTNDASLQQQQRPFQNVKQSRHKSTTQRIERQTPSSAMAKNPIVIDLSDNSSVASLSSDDDEDAFQVTTGCSQAATVAVPSRPSNATNDNTRTHNDPKADGCEAVKQLVGLQDSVNSADRDTGSQLSHRVGELGSPYAAQTRLSLHREPAAAADSEAGPQPKKISSFVAKLRTYGTASKDQSSVADQGESFNRDNDESSRPITEQHQQSHAKIAQAPGATSRQTHRGIANDLKCTVFHVPKEQGRTSKTMRAASSSSDSDDGTSKSSDLTSSSDSSTSLHQDEPQRQPALPMHIHPVNDAVAAIYNALFHDMYERENVTNALLRGIEASGQSLVSEVAAVHEAEMREASNDLRKLMQAQSSQFKHHKRSSGELCSSIKSSLQKLDHARKGSSVQLQKQLSIAQSLRDEFCFQH